MLTSVNDGQLRRKDMRDIRDAVGAGNFIAIPRALRAMKRLWPKDPGLQDRRVREAKLFEEGLKQLPRAVSWHLLSRPVN